MVACHPQSLALCIVFFALTFPIIAPDFALDYWLAILGAFERHRTKRLARKSKQLDEKMKKYWVIDMRKLR